MTDPELSRFRLVTAGLVIDVWVDDSVPALADDLPRLWADSVTDDLSGDADLEVEVCGHKASSERDPRRTRAPRIVVDRGADAPAYVFSGRLTQFILEELVGEKILLHAGTVVLDGLGPVVLTGASGAGKSTAVTTLAASGGYVTDELTILDPGTWTLTPFSKPISRVMNREGSKGRVKEDVALADLGIRVAEGVGSLRPRHLILVARDASAEGVEVTTLGLMEVLSVLAGQSSSVWKLESPLGTLARFRESLDGVWVARYAESSELEQALREAAARAERAAVREDYEVLSPDGAERRAPESGEYALTDFHEALWCQGEFAVLTAAPSPTLVRLPGIGAVVWDILYTVGPANEDALVAATIEYAGPHPEARELVKSALEAAVAEGVIRKQE